MTVQPRPDDARQRLLDALTAERFTPYRPDNQPVTPERARINRAELNPPKLWLIHTEEAS